MKRFSAALVAGVVSLLLTLAACSTNPVTGESQLVLISEEQEVALGKQYYPIATQLSEGETPHRSVQELVTRVGMKMARKSERPNLTWEFSVVESNTPNAYALPGGTI